MKRNQRVYAYTFMNGETVYWTIESCQRVPLVSKEDGFAFPSCRADWDIILVTLDRVVDLVPEHAHERDAETIDTATIEWPNDGDVRFPVNWDLAAFDRDRQPQKLRNGVLVELIVAIIGN